MKSIPAKLAFQTLIKGRPYSTWASQEVVEAKTHQITEPGNGGARVYKADPAPVLKPKFTLPLDAGIFTAGSCFAREVEAALLRHKGNVLSWTPATGLRNSLFHRYTTHAITNDFRLALEDSYDEANVVPYGKQWIDFTGHGAADTREEMVSQRRKVIEVYKRSAKADAIFLTFGLVEAWYDKETQQYLNIPPWGRLDSDRYVMRITDYSENRAAIEGFVSYVRKAIRPDLKIILTVSPVPLDHTFSGQDIVVANTYSKATLRAVVQDIANSDPLIDYFPSYEMVTLADPDEAWYLDFRHVRRDFVEKIMRAFMDAYLTLPPPESAEIPSTRADGTHHNTLAPANVLQLPSLIET